MCVCTVAGLNCLFARLESEARFGRKSALSEAYRLRWLDNGQPHLSALGVNGTKAVLARLDSLLELDFTRP